MANLSRVAFRTPNHTPTNDHATTDTARPAIEIDDVINTASSTKVPLSHSSKACIIGGVGFETRRLLKHLRDRLVFPTKVWRMPHQTILRAHQAGDSDTYTNHSELRL